MNLKRACDSHLTEHVCKTTNFKISYLSKKKGKYSSNNMNDFTQAALAKHVTLKTKPI